MDGIGRSTSPAAEAVSRDLRTDTSRFMRLRRRTTALSLLSTGALGLVEAYQAGLLRHLPEPPLAVFDADRVDASGEAYELFKTPDAALGMVSFAVTAALAGMGGARRSDRRPWVPLALAAKVAADAAGSLLLTAEQVTKHRRLCSWCLLSAAASLATVPAAVPEAAAAWRSLRRRR
ncbi:MAG TPA: vitamin K epoxide reductase family protein [Acidimicrobiales bacterium]|nr:vitamin K epoxide reductase family protein [Acidimicrobiales bacterium]